MATNLKKTSKIVIVGAGVFGLSTADHLLRRGYTTITVLDRAEILPAKDAASCDINKIVRSSYSDLFYSRLAKEAIDLWKDKEDWEDSYHESGVFVIHESNVDGGTYTDQSYTNDIALGARIRGIKTSSDVRTIFPAGAQIGSFDGLHGYFNQDGGWANAARGVELLIWKVLKLGAELHAAKSVVELIKDERGERTVAVKCEDGTRYDADVVVIAAGSWTPSTFPELDLMGKCLATGQTVATVQLTQEEGDRYRDCPVVLDFGSGFYIFPPNVDNIVKMAIHDNGFLYKPSAETPSTPRTSLSDGPDGLRIPKSVLERLRTGLRLIYPELAEKPFSGTRLCWYNDSPDDDWVIGYHPADPALMLATAGSGHAYKFLPNIGQLVADAMEGVMDPELVKRFSVDRELNVHILSRSDAPSRELKLNELCTEADLQP